MNHAPVLFKNGGTIERISRERFAELAEAGAVSLETPVFNNTLTRVGDLRPARRWAWHQRRRILPVAVDLA